jgi:hypothetical protein
MVSKKAIVAVSVIAVFAVIAVLFLWRPSPNGKTIFEDTIEPVIIYTPNLVVNGYESDGHWTRSMTTNLPEHVSTISCSVSNTGNAEAQDVNFEIRVDGNLVVAELVQSIPVQGRQNYSYTVTMPYDSLRAIEVKTWCSESLDIHNFSIEHNFPRYWSENPDILKLFITPNENSVVWREHQIIENKFFLTPNWIAIRNWVGDNIQYKGDTLVHDTDEYWQFGAETMRLGTGDCEDFSILLCSLLRANGWSSNEVYVVIGKNDKGYHAWVKIDMGILGWYHLEPQSGSWGLIGDIGLWLSGYDSVYQFNDIQFQQVK